MRQSVPSRPVRRAQKASQNVKIKAFWRQIRGTGVALSQPSTVLFVDDVRIEPSEVCAEGSLFVDPAADYLKDHFPGAPMLPGLLMLEASVRTAAALWRVQSGTGPGDEPVLARVDRLQVVRRVVPGETFVVRVELSGDRDRERAAFMAQGRVGDETAMRARFELVRREIENRFPGEDRTQA